MGRKVAVNFILGLDCLYDLAEPLGDAVAPSASNTREVNAPLFALEAPADARAGVPFSLNAWVGLTDPLYAGDEILADSFRAELDPRACTITVTGKLRRRPGSAPDGPRIQRALVVGIRVVAPAGVYALQIPPTHYAAEAGLMPPAGGDVPAARSVQWLQVRP
ncbi:MAG: hypothetical protein JWM80_4643 [Cyanobacteria bacterium RYN_339]|nr:hypothetical protein [Cyanobacteria bacterium RYN_339]